MQSESITQDKKSPLNLGMGIIIKHAQRLSFVVKFLLTV